MTLTLDYDSYLDRILGGWIGKSIGGTIGARFEGFKGWIEIDPSDMFPNEIPPNDDLDLQVLWLKVLEEKGEYLTSDDLAQAWSEHCWYPFNEYGTFRRNWQLGIHPPYSGSWDNAFWETGMGCPIRSEIWGYVYPGAPDLAAACAELDGVLDHTAQSVGAEKMLAAMASMAFFVGDVRRLIDMTIHHLPPGTPIARLTHAALSAHARGLCLREARQLLLSIEGHPEACDAQTNVPFTLLALLYGENDLQETLLAALRCGYDTDCTLATSAALVGQIVGARAIPAHLREPIGDQLVMGISYHRLEMTLSALARDTVRIGTLFCENRVNTAITISNAPALSPLPQERVRSTPSIRVEYCAMPSAAPGDTVGIRVHVEGALPSGGTPLRITCPEGWTAMPSEVSVTDTCRAVEFSLHACATMPTLPMRNLFDLQLGDIVGHTFGVAGAGLWRFLGVYFDPTPPPDDAIARRRAFNHHFVDPDKAYLPEPDANVAKLYGRWSRILGRPALIAARDRMVDLAQVTGLRGEYAAYLARTIICPDDREVFFVVGHNDGYRLYLNGEKAGTSDEQIWWTPFNTVHRVSLRQGENHLLVKLIKRGERIQWSFGIREAKIEGHNRNDWCIDLQDVNPLTDGLDG